MLGPRGTTWRVVMGCLFFLAALVSPGWAADHGPSLSLFGGGRPFLLAASAETPMEAQLLGEKQPGKTVQPFSALEDLTPSFHVDREGAAVLKLPKNFELRISFLYGGEPGAQPVERPVQSHLLFKYSMEYSLLPNLQVGLSGFFYQPVVDHMYFQRRYGDRVLGLGPGLRYDLGSWSFTFQSQIDTGGRERRELQNWFRLRYAF